MGDRAGLKGFFSTVDHKEIGIRYIVTAFIFLRLGGIEALLMRLQLAGPESLAARRPSSTTSCSRRMA